MWSAVKAPGFSSEPHPVVMPFTQVASSIQKINIWCFYWLYPILCCCWIMLYYGGGMTYYLILYILFHNHLIRLRECLGKWTTSLVWMWCGTSWNGYKMIQTLGHLTVSLWTQHPVFQKQHILRCSTWKGISRSLAKFFVAISSGWRNSSRMCFIFRLVPWWFPAV